MYALADLSGSTLEDLRGDKGLFDNTWTLATVLAASLALVCWYFRLARIDIGPIVWTLATSALIQLLTNARAQWASSRRSMQRFTLASQLIGTLFMAVGWHLFGGLQQPLFPLFIVLPLLASTLVLSFWQQQIATGALIAVLASGVVLSPDTNSFMEQRYGVEFLSASLPSWMPRSQHIFPDVSTSPAYDLMLLISVSAIAFAVTTIGRALVGICRRHAGHSAHLERKLAHSQRELVQLIVQAPLPEVMVSENGKIMQASDRFSDEFGTSDCIGRFLLDAVAFAYPTVIRDLMARDGEELQEATVRGRKRVLRVRSRLLKNEGATAAAMSFEPCEQLWWRAALDALDDPVFAVDGQGSILYANRVARVLLEADPQEGGALRMLGGGTQRWWDIAPLESAKRLLGRGEQQYLASIRRVRVAESIGELAFIHLQQRLAVTAEAAVA